MRDHSETFFGIDTSKVRNAIAIAEGGRPRHLAATTARVVRTPGSSAATIRLRSGSSAASAAATICDPSLGPGSQLDGFFRMGAPTVSLEPRRGATFAVPRTRPISLTSSRPARDVPAAQRPELFVWLLFDNNKTDLGAEQRPRVAERARELLREELRQGPKLASSVMAAVEAVDIPERSLIPAADALGVRAQRWAAVG